MTKQSQIFLESEGMRWYERNKDKLPPKDDPVMDIIEQAGIVPDNVLEIGCGNGWRLERLNEKYGCNVYGVDPYGRWPNVVERTADNLTLFKNNKFDLVIYGFLLYLVDREDLFKVVAEGDRVLKDGGYLVIHDFHPNWGNNYKRKYTHADNIFSYKMIYHRLWSSNPTYEVVDIHILSSDEDQTSVSLLKKDIAKGWPLHE